MRILHITAVHTMEGESGIPAVVKGLCDNQNKLEGVEARVLSLYANVDKVDSPYFDYLGNNSFRKYIQSYLPNFVVFHDFYYLRYASMAFYLKCKGIPFVIEPHGAFGKQAIKKSRIKKLIANSTIFRILIKGSAGFIFTNEGEKNDTAYKKKKVVVIPNGVSEDAIDKPDNKIYSANQNPIFYFLVCYDINHKGLDYMFLDILDEREQKVIVRLYGLGNEHEISFVHERINRMRNVEIEERGTIYGEAKVKALREANILLLTSRYEGSPMTILDALCYGNPCLLTPGTNVADEIVANGLGWKTELDASSIAEAILNVRKEYKKDYMGYYNRCRQYMYDHSLWEKIAKKSIPLYKYFLS